MAARLSLASSPACDLDANAYAPDRAFSITHYARLGETESAFRIAENFELVDDFFYLYKLCNIWSERTASVRADPRFDALVERWGFADYWRRFGESGYCALKSDGVRCR